jgi:hypothetical protein
MIAIIMSAGRGSRWKTERGIKTWDNYLGIPKQLIRVNGETLLARTIRLLEEGGVQSIFVSVPEHGFYGDLGVPEIVNKGTYEIDRFYPIKGEGTVLYLYGDVYYTEEAMNSILNENYEFFGRRGKSKLGSKNHSEMFAVKADNTKVKLHVNKLKELFDAGVIKRCIGWDLFKSFYNLPLSPEKVPSDGFKHLFIINDLTDDFDNPNDYERWKKVYERVTK